MAPAGVPARALDREFGAAPLTAGKTEVFGVRIDVLDLGSAVRRIVDLRVRESGGSVVTPNLDHVVALRGDERLRTAYRNASLVLADGMPLVWASRLAPTSLPERVAGSDLIVPLCAAAAESGLRVFLFGSSYQMLCESARKLSSLTPGLEIAGVYAPAQGFHADAEENVEILAFLERARPDLIFIALGNPKQEIWAERYREQLSPAVLISIGAGLDFIAGGARRAPPWVRSIGLEWFHRVLGDPIRLGPRYAKDLLALPGLIAGQLVSRIRSSKH